MSDRLRVGGLDFDQSMLSKRDLVVRLEPSFGRRANRLGIQMLDLYLILLRFRIEVVDLLFRLLPGSRRFLLRTHRLDR